MDDYKKRGKNIDIEYARMMAESKKKRVEKLHIDLIAPSQELKPQFLIPAAIVGKQVIHKTFGAGKIIAIEGASIAVQFDKSGPKRLGYEFCMQKNLLEFI